MSLAKIRKAWRGAMSLFAGLGVTGRALGQQKVTLLYPMQEVDNLASFRGHVELTPKDDAPAEPKCVACSLCAKVCPSHCITILCELPLQEGKTEAQLAPAPQKGVKKPVIFTMDYSLCSLCGQCVKSCASGAIRFSHNGYMVSTERKDFTMDLIELVRKHAQKQP